MSEKVCHIEIKISHDRLVEKISRDLKSKEFLKNRKEDNSKDIKKALSKYRQGPDYKPKEKKIVTRFKDLLEEL